MMIDTQRNYPQLLIAITITLALSIPMISFTPTVEADMENPVQVNLFLKHDDTPTHYMNSLQGTPTDENQQNGEIVFPFGWLEGGDVVDTELKEDLYITGTNVGGDEVRVELEIYVGPLSSTDVDISLLDNEEEIAAASGTLDGGITSGDSEIYWELTFTANSDGGEGGNHHTFEKGHEMKLKLVLSDNAEVRYRDGEAHLEFLTNQLSDHEFNIANSDGDDMDGQYFTPKPPTDSELGVAWISGSVIDAFSYRDIDHVELNIVPPDGETNITEDNISAEQEAGKVKFNHNWTFSDDLVDENDAGDYYVDITFVDNNENEFTFEEELKIKINKYGAYVELDEDEDKEKDIKPGEYTKYRFIVYNAGLTSDTILLSHSDLSDDWSVSFDEDTLELGVENSQVVTINVSADEDIEVGSEVDVKVTATSENSKDENDPEYPVANHDITTTTRVVAAAKISVFFKESDSNDDDSEWEDTQSKSGNAEKGTDKDFIFRVKNDSPSDDNITLFIDGKPADWDVEIVNPDSDETIEYIEIESNDEQKLWVRVTPATSQNAANNANIEITGESGNNESVTDTAFLNVTRTLGVIIEETGSENMDELNPGVPNNLEFKVINTGNEERTFNLIVDDSKVAPEGWTISPRDDSLDVQPGSSEITIIDVTPPDSVERRDSGYEIILTAEAEDDSSVTYSFDVSMNVKSVYGVEITITNREKTVEEAGESVDYLIRVRNTGNSEVTIHLQTDKNKDDWGAKLSSNAENFAPGDEKQFTLTVTAPDPVDNKEKCKVTVEVKILGHSDTKDTEITTTNVDKGEATAITDTIEEYSWIISLGLVVLVIAVVVYFRSSVLEDEEYYEEEYEEEEYDDWE